VNVPALTQESETTRDISDTFRNWREDLDSLIDQIEIVVEDTVDTPNPPPTKARLVFTRKGVQYSLNGFTRYRKRYIIVLLPFIPDLFHLVAQYYEKILALYK
jgi:hypothetical protein